MAIALTQRKDVKEYTYIWEGVDRANRQLRGESKAASETVVTTNLRRQGIRVTKIKRQTFRGGKRVSEKDITFFTRQLATMLRAGVPLLQSFEIVARGHSNARFSRLVMDLKSRVESGSSLSQAFREHPVQFDNLYCNLVGAGETAGMLDGILDRLATYKEKILAIKSKIKTAMFYPISVVIVAFVVTWVILVFVIPAFKQVFTSFGADLPAPTLIVMALSDFRSAAAQVRAGRETWRGYLSSLRGRKVFGLSQLRDPGPFLYRIHYATLGRLLRVVRRAVRTL